MKCIGLMLLALCLWGCEDTSPILTETAVVEQVSYLPSQTYSGVSTSGRVAFGSTDPVFSVVFRCQHGKFIVQGDTERKRLAWTKARTGDHVLVRYRQHDDGKMSFVSIEPLPGDAG